MNNGGYLVLNAPIVIKGSGCTLGKIANGRGPQEKLVLKKKFLVATLQSANDLMTQRYSCAVHTN